MNAETERIFERLVVDRGAVTPEQLAEVQRLRAAPGGGDRGLVDLLTERDYGDPATLQELAQLAAIRSGAERVSIGGFELLEKVGQGGMAVVYRANQVNVGRSVALKLMRPKLAKDSRYLERFLREARASARLSHPNIVQGIDAGQDKGYYYFAMELIDGDTLRRIIGREGALPQSRCLEIGIQIAQALAAAAKIGVVHRDVKPENILIENRTGVAKLADLGLVKSSAPTDTSVTQTGVALGTPNYISPEQARGDEKIDIRSDIYSLGATLYHAATGTLPFEGDTAPVLMSKHISDPLDAPHSRNPDVSIQFSRVIQKMMAKKPEQRYQAPPELLADLERTAKGEQPAALQPQAARRRRGGATAFKKPKVAAAVIALSALAAVGLTALLLSALGPAERPAQVNGQTDDSYEEAMALLADVSARNEVRTVIQQARESLDRDPNGPHARGARDLIKTARSFLAVTENAEDSPEAWQAAVQDLRALAATGPAWSPAVEAYIHATLLRRMQAVMSDADYDPTTVPQARAWLEAALATARDDDTEVKREARGYKRDLPGLLSESPRHILGRYAKKAERLAQSNEFAGAIRELRSCVPENLRSSKLLDLIDTKTKALLREAAEFFDQKKMEQHIWGLLDSEALDRARLEAAHLRKTLRVPGLEKRVDALCRTVAAAPGFLPLFAKAKALEAGGAKNEKEVAALAQDIDRRFGRDPYVASRLKKYRAAIDRRIADQRITKHLGTARQLIDQNKCDEADTVLATLLRDPKLTDAQRREALELQTKLGTAHGLIRALAAALKPRLPVPGVRLQLKADSEPDLCTITAADPKSLTVQTDVNGKTVTSALPWKSLSYSELRELALGKVQLIDDDNASGLYYLGALCYSRKDYKEAKRLLRMAVALAKKRTDRQVPGRKALIASGEAMIATLSEGDAGRAWKELQAVVADVRTATQLDKAVAAWREYNDLYAGTAHAKANTAALQELATELGKKVMQIRTAPVKPWIRDGEWRRIVPVLEKALAETEKIAPLPAQSKATAQSLITFGKRFLAETVIFDKVFSVRPWDPDQIGPLLRHKDPQVVARATRYRKIFEVGNVNCQRGAAEQRRYAVVETRDGKPWSVRDANVRLARFNAVFLYWRKERGECAQAEIGAACEFRHTGRGGSVMGVVMMEDLLKHRRKVPKDVRAAAQYERLQAYIRCARGGCPALRKYVIQWAKESIYAHREGNFPARFCLMLAEQYEAAGDDRNALKYFEKMIDFPAKWKSYAWHGHLGRGRIREREKNYIRALFDYEAALRRSRTWHDGYRCAEAIANLCVHSGKLDKRASAERAVREVLSRTDRPSHRERIGKLLEKK